MDVDRIKELADSVIEENEKLMNVYIHYIPSDYETDNAISSILHKLYANFTKVKDLRNNDALNGIFSILDSLVRVLSKAVSGNKIVTFEKTSDIINPIKNFKQKALDKHSNIEAKAKALAKFTTTKLDYIVDNLPQDNEKLKSFAKTNVSILQQLREFADDVKAEYPELASVLYSYCLLFHTVNNFLR